MSRYLCVWLALFAVAWADKEIVVDLSLQKAYAYQDGEVVFEGRISSGKRGHETPTGNFAVLEKKRRHISNLWPKPGGGATMNYMLRLTRDGIAMHLGYVPNYPASHGCIRMKNGFAQRMFKWAEVGTPVTIEGDASEYRFGQSHRRYGSTFDDAYGVVEFHD